MRPGPERNAAIALGIAVIALMGIMETAVAHRVHPNPASPTVWTALGSVAIVALGAWLRFRTQARAARRDRSGATDER